MRLVAVAARPDCQRETGARCARSWTGCASLHGLWRGRATANNDLEEHVPDTQTSTIRTTGREHITALVARSRKKLSTHDRSTVLHQLIAQYAALPADAAPLAHEVRQAFLRTL